MAEGSQRKAIMVRMSDDVRELLHQAVALQPRRDDRVRQVVSLNEWCVDALQREAVAELEATKLVDDKLALLIERGLNASQAADALKICCPRLIDAARRAQAQQAAPAAEVSGG